MSDTARPKVFCIGFHKTGTTSLGLALAQLGYRVTGPNWVYHGNIARTYQHRCRTLSHLYDAFQDNPWPLVYRQMDAQWPGAKFILTTRDPQAWITSVTAHFGTDDTPMRRLIYGDALGAPMGNTQAYVDRYQRHTDEVRHYFRNRPDALLELDLTQGDPWAALGPFLGVACPAGPFPHANRDGTDRSITLGAGIRRRIRRLYV